MTYDSRPDTEEHIKEVQYLFSKVLTKLSLRSWNHDESKLQEPEKEIFDKYTPLLRGTTYGSERYTQFLGEMGSALAHHYENNSHHPEHYPNGVNGMSLLDVLEMLVDWKAAAKRHSDGSIEQSLQINKERF